MLTLNVNRNPTPVQVCRSGVRMANVIQFLSIYYVGLLFLLNHPSTYIV